MAFEPPEPPASNPQEAGTPRGPREPGKQGAPRGIQRDLIVFALVVGGALGSWYLYQRSESKEIAPEPTPPIVVRTESEPGEVVPQGVAFHGSLDAAVDGAEFSEPVYYLEALRELRSYSPEEFSKRVTENLDYPMAMSSPKELRGRFVRHRGIVAGVWAVKLHGSEAAGIDDVYRAVITDTDGSDGVVIDLTAPPPEFEPRRDVVEVEGVFFRTVRFEAQENKKVVERVAPYLLCRSFKVVDPKTLKRSVGLPPGGGIAIVIAVLALVWITYRVFTLKSRPLMPTRPLGGRALRHYRPLPPMPSSPPSDPGRRNS